LIIEAGSLSASGGKLS